MIHFVFKKLFMMQHIKMFTKNQSVQYVCGSVFLKTQLVFFMAVNFLSCGEMSEVRISFNFWKPKSLP